MKILVIAATEAEIALSVKHIGATQEGGKGWFAAINDHNIHFAVTGVGMTATAYHLTKLMTTEVYDLVLQVGVAGSFDMDLQLGTVVFVKTDRFGDLGAEDHEKYIDVFEMGLVQESESPFTNRLLPNTYEKELKIDLPGVYALTKNTVSGNGFSIAMLRDKYSCDIESMEGAAFHYVCTIERVKFAQIRAISNYVEPRNKGNWQLGAAIERINSWLISYLSII